MDPNVNNSYHNTTDGEIDTTTFVIDLILLLTNLLAILACAVVIYIIVKHKPLKAYLNMLILQWAILDILHLVTSPAIFAWHRQALVLDFQSDYEKIYICLFLTFELGIMLLLLTMMLEEYLKFVELHFRKIFVMVWFTVVFICIMGIVFGRQKFMALVISESLPCLALPVVIIITCVIYFRTKKHLQDSSSKLKVILTVTYVCFWLVFVTCFIITHRFHRTFGYFILVSFAFLPLNSLINLYLLVKLDQNFKMCFFKMLRCKLENYSDVTYIRSNEGDEEALRQ